MEKAIENKPPLYGLLVMLGILALIVGCITTLYVWSQMGMWAGLFALFQTVVLGAVLLCFQWIIETLGGLDVKVDNNKIERQGNHQSIAEKISVPNHEILQKLYDLENHIKQLKV
ncbi:hypothetical protein [Deefgea piscis]|uniref:hypothetical protein n=1 Tax=Deefgea piscis TaxID=2739061 RepID=UPI001C80BBE0|nr:hypothetical protein [Deefgea piscis]QZA81467.1 hypothetical protein K4H25_02010 [Deefgea piscis]